MNGIAGCTVLRQLSDDGSSILYQARRDEDAAHVLVKSLKAEYPAPNQIAKIRHEYAILSELDLPGVVKVLALEKSANGVALVMEDLGETALHDLLRAGPVPIDAAVRIGIALAGALASLHQQNVIHKDVKPQNVLVDAHGGGVKLIDFGIATRLSQEVQRPVAPAGLEGTLAYMSPEQTGRMNRSCDSRTDLYSLGVTLYEVLTGSLPFRTMDAVEMVHCHIARRPRDPRALRPEIPEVLSAIVMKLLAKAPEDRYQGAQGLKEDLECCLDQLRRSGTIAEFPLARHDTPGELRIRQKLYGREAESQRMFEAFERASRGARELLLLTGYSGIGKSALVAEIHKPIAGSGGTFISGKFDQYSRSVPYAPLAHAFRDLLRHVLSEPSEAHARWRADLLAALGPHGGVLADLLPELELLIGKQPSANEAGLTEAQNRFARAFLSFVRVFTPPGRPLVLFLDDLQWADAGSLRLLHLMLAEPDGGNLLVIGAYRDNEVAEGHILSLALAELHQSGVVSHEIHLKALAAEHVTQLLADTLGCSAERAEPLARLVLQKTHGNPFFLNQFLRSLYKEKLLALDGGGAWTWDLARIQSVAATDNVVAFVIGTLQKLPADTQRVLSLAACIGHEFELERLALFNESSCAETAAALWPALREGLVLPLSSEYRFVNASVPHDGFDVSYKFLHDRVQQAAYELNAPPRRLEVHLWNGRLMRAKYEREPCDKDLFDLVAHMNVGASLVDDPEELKDLARLNLIAGQRAKDATGYDVAAKLVDTCLSLLGEGGWSTEYELTSLAHLAKAEIAFLRGDVSGALHVLEKLDERPEDAPDRVGTLKLKTVIFTTIGRPMEAAECAVQAARLLGLDVPLDEAGRRAAIEEDWRAVLSELDRRPIESLLELPQLRDTDRARLIDLLRVAIPPAYQATPELMTVITLKAMGLILRFGTAANASYFCAIYGLLHASLPGRAEEGYALGKVGVALSERARDHAVAGACRFVFGALVSHWKRHLAESLEHLRFGLKASLEAGDHVHVGSCAARIAVHRLAWGDDLAELERETESGLALARRIGDVTGAHLLAVVGQVAKNLRGATREARSLGDDAFDEAQTAKALEANPTAFAHYLVLAQMVRYHAGDPRGALDFATRADAWCHSARGCLVLVEHTFYRALSLAASLEQAVDAERGAMFDELARHEATLRGWADDAPDNHAARHALVAAELARLRGASDLAMDSYDRAVAAAREGGFTFLEALANDLCGAFHAGAGRAKVARVYLEDARDAYERFGASARAAAIAARHPDLIRASARPARGDEQGDDSTGAGQLDLVSAIRAAHALSSELVLDKLLERLMRTLVENAGARKGVLILNRDGALRVEAQITVDPSAVRVGLGLDVDAYRDVAASIVRFVARTGQTVLLGDASSDRRFAGDPYIARARPRSLLCLAMTYQGRTTGILYLENDATTQAFSPARTELLKVISTQAAIAVDNALLYADVKVATERLRHANETLEKTVAERTAELRHALKELWSEMDLARKIQTVLLPTRPELGGYDVSAVMLPASSVGGDYYDIFEANGARWVLVGDVSGHGVPAGLVMMMVRTAIRVASFTMGRSKPLDPSTLVATVNLVLRESFRKMGNEYMTLTALRIDDGVVRYAGLHLDLLVHRARSGKVEAIESQGMWLGLLDDITPFVEDRTLHLDPEDTLLLYTDGVTESRLDGRLLDTSGLAAMFAEAVREDRCERVVSHILARLKTRRTDDDVTLVALRRLQNAGGARG